MDWEPIDTNGSVMEIMLTSQYGQEVASEIMNRPSFEMNGGVMPAADTFNDFLDRREMDFERNVLNGNGQSTSNNPGWEISFNPLPYSENEQPPNPYYED